MIRAYAIVSYLLFLASLVYIISWLADAGLPSSIDDGTSGAGWVAVPFNLVLLGIFAVQHSVMARPWFKHASATLIPKAAERATYVLVSSLAVGLIFWQWRPLNHHVWNVATQPWRAVLWTVYGTGWLIVALSTFMIGHFDLFGLRQALHGDRYVEPGFGTPGFYALVRHPIMTGFLVAFWATPNMTAGHLLFTVASTAYIVSAVRLEERDTRLRLGLTYSRYASELPRFAPAIRRR
jgi:protein-S-isoprenylcysteine O-methyltransferase Ste14